MQKFTYYNTQAGILDKILNKWKDLKLICTIPAIRSHSHPELKAVFLDFFHLLEWIGLSQLRYL